MSILNNSSAGLRPAFPALHTSGIDSPYEAISGKPVFNDFGVEVGRFVTRGDGSGGVLKNTHGFAVGDVDHTGIIRERGYVKGVIEHRPFGSLSSSGGLGGPPSLGR